MIFDTGGGSTETVEQPRTITTASGRVITIGGAAKSSVPAGMIRTASGRLIPAASTTSDTPIAMPAPIPEPSATEQYRTQQEGDLTRSVATNLAKANAFGEMTDTGTGDLPKEFSPEAVKQLAQPKASGQVIPFMTGRGGKFVQAPVPSSGSALKDVGNSVLGVLDFLDRFTLRPLRGAVYESAKEFSDAMKDPNYDVKQAPLAPFRGVYNALAGKDSYMGADTLRKVLPESVSRIQPLSALTPEFPGGKFPMPKSDRTPAAERAAGMAGKGKGPDIADILGFASDIALGSAGAKVPSPLRVGRQVTELGPATEVVTPAAKAAAKTATQAELKAIEQEGLKRLTGIAADQYQYVPQTQPFRKFRPVNTAERNLNEVMQAAQTAPIDAEATITNARQARQYLQGEFGASPSEVAAMSDAEATNLALEAQQSKALPTAADRVAREAAARGTTPEAMFSAAQENPVDRMRRLGERNRLGRAAGVTEAPRITKTPFPPTPQAVAGNELAAQIAAERGQNLSRLMTEGITPATTPMRLPQTTTKGLEVFGKEVITPAQAKGAIQRVGEFTGLNKLGETKVGQSVKGTFKALDRAFNRKSIPEGAPQSVGELPSILDRQSDIAHQTENRIIERLKPVFADIKPTEDELKLTYHLRDLGLPFTPEGAAEAVRHGELNGSILTKLTSDRLSQLAKVDDAIQSEYKQWIKAQREAGIMINERPDYVTHVIQLNKDAANEYEKAFPNALSRFRSAMSGNHAYLKERSIDTIAQAKAINAAARARGIPEPLKIVTENYLDAFSRYSQAASRAITNRHVFKDMARKFPELIVESKDSPGNGWVQATQVPGLADTLGTSSHVWLHPAAAQKLSDELISMARAGGSAEQFGELLQGLNNVSSKFRGLLTTARFPKFQLRNLIDNTAKRFVFDAMGNNAEAAAVMQGGEKAVTLAKPVQLRDFTFVDGAWKHTPGSVEQVQSLTAQQWKDLFSTMGLTETGQFGRYGDIATTIKHEVNKGALGKAADFPKNVGRATEDASKVAIALDKAQQIGDLEAGVKEANRILFRYPDLAPFERDIVRPAGGFYTFPRKNIPLMSKALLSNPEKFAQIGLAANEVRDKSVDVSSLPDYQRQELSVPIRLPNGKIFVATPGFSVGDAFKVFPSRWPGVVADTANPLVTNTVANSLGVDRYLNKFSDQAPKEPPGIIPDAVAKYLPGAVTATVDGREVVRIPAQTRAWLDEALMGAPGEIAAIMAEDKPDETKAQKLLKFFLGTLGKTTTDQELRIRDLRAANANVSQRLKAFKEVTQQPIGIRKFQPLPQTIGK